MRRPFLLLALSALVACADQNAGTVKGNELDRALPSKSTSHPQSELAPARFFVDPANRRFDVQAVRDRMEPMITLAGHYSQAIVNCGTGCTASWIVDRRTGAIIEVPPGLSDTEEVYGVQGGRESDMVQVTYGPADGSPGACRARNFRLSGTTFTATGGFSPAPCP